MIDWIQHQLTGNQFAQGAVMATVLGGAMAYCKAAPRFLWQFGKRKLLCSVSINDSSDHLQDFLKWILNFPTFANIKTLNLMSPRRRFSNETPDSHSKAPDSGVYLGWIRRRPVWLHISLTKSDTGQWNWNITLSTFAFSEKFIHRLIKDFEEFVEKAQNKNLIIRFKQSHHDWSLTKKLPRALSSVYFNGNLKEEIVEDAETFCKSAEKYANAGRLYKRTYAFFSSPGTGKSSFAMALASHLGRPLYVVNLGDYKNDEDFIAQWSEIESKSIILFDDIDVHNFNLTRDENEKDKLSLASVLNSLDGTASLDDVIIILTTNNPDKLDEALMRPGRVDKIYHLDYFSFETAVKMAGNSISSPEDFVEKNFGKKEGFYIKPAELQEKLFNLT